MPEIPGGRAGWYPWAYPQFRGLRHKLSASPVPRLRGLVCDPCGAQEALPVCVYAEGLGCGGWGAACVRCAALPTPRRSGVVRGRIGRAKAALRKPVLLHVCTRGGQHKAQEEDGSSVAQKTRGPFLSQSMRQEDGRGEDTSKWTAAPRRYANARAMRTPPDLLRRHSRDHRRKAPPPGMNWRRGGTPPLKGAQPTPSRRLPHAKFQLRRHL